MSTEGTARADNCITNHTLQMEQTYRVYLAAITRRLRLLKISRLARFREEET